LFHEGIEEFGNFSGITDVVFHSEDGGIGGFAAEIVGEALEAVESAGDESHGITFKDKVTCHGGPHAGGGANYKCAVGFEVHGSGSFFDSVELLFMV
jgi:hypothetical protein